MNQVLKFLEKYNSFLIVSHKNPDVDSVCSQLAVYNILTTLNKKAIILNSQTAPSLYNFLPFVDVIKKYSSENTYNNFEAIIVTDSSSLDRLSLPPDIFKNKKVLNIDHHADNNLFGNVNYIKAKASCSCEIIFNIAKKLKLELNKDFCTYIYTGIIGETGCFKFNNTNAKAFKIACELFKLGLINHSQIVNSLFSSNSLKKVLLRGKVFSTARLVCNNKVLIMEIPAHFFTDLQISEDEAEGLSDEALSVKDANFGILVRYRANSTKFNFRSSGNINAGVVAKHFGGGGHFGAASCEVPKTDKEVLDTVINFVESMIQNNV